MIPSRIQPSALEIPALGRVPRSFLVARSNALAARTALALMDMGVLEPGTRATGEMQALGAGLTAWLERHLGKPKRLAIGLYYNDTTGRRQFLWQQEESEREHSISLAFAVPDGGWPVYLAGARLGALERAHRGLGETVLHWIDRAAGASGFRTYTPSVALSCASFTWWMGTDNEIERISHEIELGDVENDEGELDERQLAAVCPTRRQWDAQLPRWAQDPRERVKGPELERLAARRGLAGSAAHALLEIRRVYTRERRRLYAQPDRDGFVTAMTCGLMWAKGYGQLMNRVWDDFFGEVSQAGDMHGEHFEQGIALEDLAAALPAWLARLEPNLRLARALDALVDVAVTERL